MSVAIAELSVSVNQDLFRPKGDLAQNGLFEEVMRESHLQEELSFQSGKLITQNLKQVERDLLVDGAIDLIPEQLMDENSRDLKKITFFVFEQEDVKNKNDNIKVISDFVEQQHVKNKNIALNSDLVGQDHINNKDDGIKVNQDLVEGQHNDVQIIFPALDDPVNPFIFDHQQKRADDVTKDPKDSLMFFTAGQKTDLESSQKQVDLDDSIVKNPSLMLFTADQKADQESSQTQVDFDDSIVKNPSFFIEVPLKLEDVDQEVDTKISTPYFAANFIVQEKNSADLGSIKKENSILRNIEQVAFQANGAAFLDVNNKFEDSKLSLHIENEAKEFLKENTPVETLKLVDQKNINQQLNVSEHSPRELIEEKHQIDGEKLINQVSGHHHELQPKIIAQPKIDVQSGFSSLTTSNSNNYKEFILTNQSNSLNQINEQNKSMIGLKIGNITHQGDVQSLKISILPHELGTIKLDLKTNVETKLTEAHFTFSHQDGFDLFQGNRQDLLALLGKSGLDIQPDKVSFDLLNFSDSSSQFAQEHPKNAHDLNQKTHFFKGINNESSPEEMKQIQSNLTATSLLNLMV